jgi:hypothetical protein
VPVLRHPTTGEVINVPDEQVGHAVVQGYQPVSLQEAAQTTAAATPSDQGGVVGGINALATGALSGLTLGGSDVALSGLLDPGQLERLSSARSQHGTLSTIGQIGGALAPSLLGAPPGSLLARSPAGIASRIGSGLAELGEGAGTVARIGAHVASGAAEGALQNAGAYVADVALGDRDLSADAFVGAMGQGALWGGAGSGALALSGEALAKARGLLGGTERGLPARKLFAAQDTTAKAAQDTRAAASKEIGEALDDGATLEQRATQAIADQRNLALATDPAFAKRAAELSATPYDAELEGLLTGLKAPQVSPEGASLGRFDLELETLLHGLDVPDVGEVGGRLDKRPPISTEVIGRPPDLGVPKSDLNDALDARARQLDSTRVGKVKGAASAEPAAPTSTPASGRIDVHRLDGGQYEARYASGKVVKMSSSELDDWVDRTVPPGFSASGVPVGGEFSISTGIPKSASEVDPDALYIVKPHEFAERGVHGNVLKDTGRDSILDAWAKGKRLKPINVDMTPDGKLYVEDGNHRLQAAAGTDRPVAVRIKVVDPKSGWSPQRNAIDITDRIKADLSAPPIAAGATDLQSLLEGTKARLDQGQELGAMGGMRPRARGEALDAELAKSNPTVAKLQAAVSELRSARSDLEGFLAKTSNPREYAASLRREGPGWRESVPAGEGNALGARGRQIEWKGSELERNNAEFRINNKVKPEERVAAGRAVDEMMARRGMTAEERIAHALEQHPESVASDIGEAAQVIGRYEAAHAGIAELAQTLGIPVPSGAAARAEGFRAAQSHAEQATQQATAIGADGLNQTAGHVALGGKTPAARAAADKTVRDPTMGAQVREWTGGDKTVSDPGLRAEIGVKHAAGMASTAPMSGSMVGHAANAGAIYEALRMMGVPLPDPHDIPVIGPLLSVYLKARVIGKAFGRFGGRVAETAETTIARKAAETKQRVFAAVDAILHGVSKAAIAAAPAAGGAAAILAHRLFDGSHPAQVGKVDTDTKDMAELYQRRSSELAEAAQPGAIRQAIQARIRATDPTIVNAIADGFERQVQFLLDKMPKPLEHQGILPGSTAYTPNRGEMTKFSRYVQAATDPASVLEQVAAGGVVTPEAAEAIQVVYPSLFAAAQKRLLEQAADVEHPIPYGRRVQASLLFDVPLDSTMTPSYAAWAQQGYATPAPPPSATGATLHAPVTISQMTQGPRP